MPAAATDHRPPVVRRRLAGRPAPVSPNVPVAPGRVAARARLAKPGMLVAGVIEDHVQDQFHASGMHRRDQGVDGRHVAVLGGH